MTGNTITQVAFLGGSELTAREKRMLQIERTGAVLETMLHKLRVEYAELAQDDA